MESSIPWPEPASWTPPQWLERHLVPDGRFARAYNALADDRRALLKGLIARHYILNPPRQPQASAQAERFDLFTRTRASAPVSFVLVLTEAVFDAPALFLAALMPALCARVPQVLAVRLGKRSAMPDSFLTGCELAGQESVAALGPVLLQRLLLECAASGEGGVVLHPDTPVFRRLLGQGALRAAIDTSGLRLVPLRLPQGAGLWRDAGQQLPAEDVTLLYGGLRFEEGGARPGRRNRAVVPDEIAWRAFNSASRDLLLLPEARIAQARAGVCVAESCLGQWRWPELWPGLFLRERQLFGTT